MLKGSDDKPGAAGATDDKDHDNSNDEEMKIDEVKGDGKEARLKSGKKKEKSKSKV